MQYKLYLDDLRSCPIGYMLARSCDEAISIISEYGMPTFISFDHDLGLDKSGFDLAKWLVEQDMNAGGNFIPKDFKFVVHSANQIGRENIEGLLHSYLRQR